MAGNESGTPVNQASVEPTYPNPSSTTTDEAATQAAKAAAEGASVELTSDEEAADSQSEARRRILIGSQRDPVAYRARRQRDWEPVADAEGKPDQQSAGDTAAQPQSGEGGQRKGRHRHDRRSHGGGHGPQSPQPLIAVPQAPVTPPQAPPSVVAASVPYDAVTTASAALAQTPAPHAAHSPTAAEVAAELPAAELSAAVQAATPSVGRVAAPSPRDRLTPEMEDELNRAMDGASLDDLMSTAGTGIGLTTDALLEPESKLTGRVVAVRRDDVFIELSGREQGCIPLHQFTAPPAPGTTLEVIVQRFNAEEGLYDLALPGTAMDIADWGDIREGMLVDASVTGHNTGGLECEVNHIRGFIPISQVALYRVEDLAPFVGQHLNCLITEANPARKNLVLSHRAVLEREKEEAHQKFFASLEPGQVHDGVVRKLMDFGAFVDIGGADGLLHISQLAWSRVNHPRDVLTEGQKIRVKIEKIDRETGKIGFSYRDMLENPWTTAATKFLPQSVVRGKVTRLMEFGAFVELEPGVEGLVHISELAPKRVYRASDVVKEGEEVDVMILAVNQETQRISLSIKALAKPDPAVEAAKKKEEEAGQLPVSPKKKHRPEGSLGGGLGRPSGGDRFGLKW